MQSLPYKIIAFGVTLIIAFGVGWKVKGWKDDSQYKKAYLETLEQISKVQAQNLVLSKEYAAETKAYQQVNEELNHHVKIEIQQNPVYRDCALPDNGLQLINAAVDQANRLKSSH